MLLPMQLKRLLFLLLASVLPLLAHAQPTGSDFDNLFKRFLGLVLALVVIGFAGYILFDKTLGEWWRNR